MVSVGISIWYACVRLCLFLGILFSLLVDAKVDQFSCEASSKMLYVEIHMWDLLHTIYDVWSRSGSSFVVLAGIYKCVVGSFVPCWSMLK